MKIRIAIVLAAALATPSMWAADRGTPAEAKAMLAKAVAHYKDVGREQALADFNSKKAPFGDRDLYVVCLAPDHTIAANGGFPAFVGQPVDRMKDADGKPLGKAIWDAAGGEGSVHYSWINPVSHKTEPKVTFSQKVGDDVCAVGAYNP
jgi:cytochrome c